MASFFNIKGTTQNEFSLGVKGPILKRENETLILPNLVTAKTINLLPDNSDDTSNGSLTKYEYSGNAVTSTKWKVPMTLNFSGITTDAISFDGSIATTINVTAIDSSLLNGDIKWANIQNLVSGNGTSQTLARSDHNHDDKYLDNTLKISTDSQEISVSGSVSNTPEENKPNQKTMQLNLEVTKLDGSKIVDESITAVKIQNATLDQTKFKTISDSNPGDYTSVIAKVKGAINAENVTTTINGKLITDIFETDGTTSKKSTLATKATQLKTPKSLWGKPFDGTKDINGEISSTGNITPETSETSDIGSESKKYKNLYLSGEVKANSISANSSIITEGSYNKITGQSTITDKNNSEISGFNNISAISMSATTFNGALNGNAKTATDATNAQQLKNNVTLWGHSTNLSNGVDIDGDITNSGTITPKIQKGQEYSVGTKDNKFSSMWATTFNGNATSANKVNNALTIKINATQSQSYDGSSAVNVDLSDLLSDAAAMVYKGTIEFDASTTQKFTPKANHGDVYVISINNNLDNTVNGIPVENGDMFICQTTTDAATTNNQTTILKNWNIVQSNIETKNLVNTSTAQSISGDKTFNDKIIYTNPKSSNEKKNIEDIFAHRDDTLSSITHSKNSDSFTIKTISQEASNTAGTTVTINNVENAKKVSNALSINSVSFDGSSALSISVADDLLLKTELGKIALGHKNSINFVATTQNDADIDWSKDNEIFIPKINYDDHGHITAMSESNIKFPNINDTLSNTYVTYEKESAFKQYDIPMLISNGKIVPSSANISNNILKNSKIETGTGADAYFQSKRFRGQGDANSYQHAIDFGYAGHNQVDFYEYGAVWNFWKNQQQAPSTTSSALVLGITETQLKHKDKTYTYPSESGTLLTDNDRRAIKCNGTDVLVSTNNKAIDFISGTATELNSDSSTGKITINTKLGTTADSAAFGNHNHDSSYSKIGHNHDDVYAPINHSHNEYLSTNTHTYVNSSNTSSLEANAKEDILQNGKSVTLNLHKIAKTGKYKDLIGRPIKLIDYANPISDENWADIADPDMIVLIRYENRIYTKMKDTHIDPYSHSQYTLYEAFGNDDDEIEETSRLIIQISKSSPHNCGVEKSGRFGEFEDKAFNSTFKAARFKTVKNESIYLPNGLVVKESSADVVNQIGILANHINGAVVTEDSGVRADFSELYLNAPIRDGNTDIIKEVIINSNDKGEEIQNATVNIKNNGAAVSQKVIHAKDQNNISGTIHANTAMTALNTSKLIKATRATTASFGGIKVKNEESFNTDPAINSRSTISGRNYMVELNSKGEAFVNVPWETVVPGNYITEDELGLKLKNYVDITSSQDISGKKTFSNASGVEIKNGSNNGSVSMKYDSSEECLEFVFA